MNMLQGNCPQPPKVDLSKVLEKYNLEELRILVTQIMNPAGKNIANITGLQLTALRITITPKPFIAGLSIWDHPDLYKPA